MLVSELRERVVAAMVSLGVAMDNLTVLPSQDSAVYEILTDCLQKWTSESGHLRDAEVELEIVTGQKIYGLTSASFSKPMAKIHSVRTDDGWVLTDFLGEPGPVKVKDLIRYELDFSDASAGKPRYWAMETSSKLRVFPEPDEDLTFMVSGTYLHPVVDSDSDEVEVELADEEPVILWCAACWAMRVQRSEALTQAYQAGLAGATAAKHRTTREVNSHRGGVEVQRYSW